ncbi:MAG: molecular chaperone DnaK [Thermodesulfobacteriota bacterium]|nr:MAG: molecular chaperone DnaK [Thermodesulfobacteriota bacterium]
MAKAVGIDLGTTNSAIAVIEGGKPKIIPNAEGNRITPSVVAFTKDGQRLVGQVAKRQAILNPERTFYSVKRFVGRRWGEVDEESKIVSYKVVRGENDTVRFEIDGKLHAPEEISAMVLRKLVDDASAYLGEKVKDVVITVPAYFNDSQRQATKDAGTIAGLNVLRIINEPTAAALAYGVERGKAEKILVFDLGGGTFDVSILEVGEGVCEVLSTSGDTHLGGDDFDKRIVDWMADEFKRDYGIDLREDRQALQRLYEAAEKAKCELSSTLETEINLPFITADAQGPKHLQMKLTRAKFEQLVDDLIKRCLPPTKQALADAKLSPQDIDEVLLVGGSTRIPAVQQFLKEFFGKEPNKSINPDEAVALGAAIQAGIIQGEVKEVVLLDVTPLSLGVETLGGVMTKVIERNTTIPVKRSQIFTTAEDNQSAVDIVICQGERPMARDNRILGQFRLEGIRPAPRGVPRIEVTFDIDVNGILNVSAKDLDTQKEQRITISGASTLDKGEVERMVKEAEMHAEEDRRRKEKAEVKNQADNLTYQIEKTIKDLGDKAPATDKARCEQLIQDIRQAVKEDAPIDRIKNLMNELQQAAQNLSAQAYQQATGGPSGTPPPEGGTSKGGEEEVIDAEYKEAK